MIDQPSLWEPDDARQVARGAVAYGDIEALRTLDWSFSDSTKRGLTHSLHPWPAKFIPAIPATAIEALTQPGETVLDPFCGCGTTGVEALSRGRNAVMADVNALAVRITQGKCEVPTTREQTRIAEWARGLIVVGPDARYLELAPDIPNREYWFSTDAAAQLTYLLHQIRELGFASAFLETVFSSIILAASNQESETRYRRIDKGVTADDVLRSFGQRLSKGLAQCREMLESSSRFPDAKGKFVVSDARTIAKDLAGMSVDLAVFSPPYPNAFDYHLYHRFRMFWLGHDPRLVKHQEIGAHLRYQPDESEWLSDMEAAFGQLALLVRPSGYVVCVVGDGIIKGQLVRCGDLLVEVGRSTGFDLIARSRRSVPTQRKSFKVTDGRLQEEYVLVLQR